MFEIIEDCSPFFIRFKHDRIEDLIKLAKEKFKNIDITQNESPVMMRKLEYSSGMDLLTLLPYKDILPLNTKRVAYFVSQPELRNHLHIDNANISFNYGINILDDKCITSWYDFDTAEKTYNSRYSQNDRRSIPPDQFSKNPIPSIASFVQKEGEGVLFNADMHHHVDNTMSTNYRTILTFRLIHQGKILYNDAKKILFNL